VVVIALTGCTGSTPLVDPIQSARVSEDGRRLTVSVLHGACEEGERRLTVTERQHVVRVRVDGARALSGDCTAIGLITELSATLDRPLGDRAVVDDSTGKPVEVS
jgi:hypothetical protein